MKKFLLLAVACFAAIAANAATLYFENDANWDKVYCWYWSPNPAGNYPGPQVTETVTDNGHTYYVVSTGTATGGCIFTDGNVKAGGGDLSVVDKGIYNSKGFTGNTFGGGTVVIEKTVNLMGIDNDWNTGKPFTTTDNENWTISLANLSGKFKIKENATWWGYSGTIELDKEYVLSNDNAPDMSLTATDVTINFNTTTHTMKITGQGGVTPPVPPTEEKDLYFIGEWNEWDLATAKQMTRNGNVYTITLEEGTGGKWKINDGTWAYNFGAGETDLEAGVEGDAWFNSDNNFTAFTGKTTITFTLVAGSDTQGSATPSKVLVTGEGGGDPIEEVYTYGIHGQITGNENWETVNLTNENGAWTWTGNIVPGNFGIMPMVNGKQEGWISSPKGKENITEAGTYTTASTDNTNFVSTLEGKYTITFSPDQNTITFTVYQGEIEEVVTYGLRGQITGVSEWTDIAMTENTDGNWEVTLNCVPGLFGLKKMVNGSQTAWFSPTQGGLTWDVAPEGSVVSGENGNFELKDAAEYTFVYEPVNNYLGITAKGAGVEAVSAENAPAVYYNLNGVRVDNPQSGLFIEVRGSKATKVYVK